LLLSPAQLLWLCLGLICMYFHMLCRCLVKEVINRTFEVEFSLCILTSLITKSSLIVWFRINWALYNNCLGVV